MDCSYCCGRGRGPLSSSSSVCIRLVNGLALAWAFGRAPRGDGDRGWLVLQGMLGIAVVFIWPVITAVVLLLVAAA